MAKHSLVMTPTPCSLLPLVSPNMPKRTVWNKMDSTLQRLRAVCDATARLLYLLSTAVSTALGLLDFLCRY